MRVSCPPLLPSDALVDLDLPVGGLLFALSSWGGTRGRAGRLFSLWMHAPQHLFVLSVLRLSRPVDMDPMFTEKVFKELQVSPIYVFLCELAQTSDFIFQIPNEMSTTQDFFFQLKNPSDSLVAFGDCVSVETHHLGHGIENRFLRIGHEVIWRDGISGCMHFVCQ